MQQKNDYQETLELGDALSSKLNSRMSLELQRKQNDEMVFASVLAKALHEEPELRRFIKEEALKRFDRDYDILYHLVRDVVVSNNETLSQKLSKYADSKTDFTEVEESLPLLNIFVPKLPGGFSPESWDIQSEIPKVAVARSTDKGLAYFSGDEDVLFLPVKGIPAFPAIAIKTNERVVLSSEVDDLNKVGVQVYGRTLQSGKFSYAFIDDAFDASKTSDVDEPNTQDATIGSQLEVSPMATPIISLPYPSTPVILLVPMGNSQHLNYPYLMAATYQKNNSNFWQRDHIYYGLTPDNTQGPIDPFYEEALYGMQFVNTTILQHISDQGPEHDPIPNQAWVYPDGPWTEGNFEFRFTILINSTVGAGATLQKNLSVSPEDLFEITYQELIPGFLYERTAISTKFFSPKLRLFAWNLQHMSYGTKIHVEEFDPVQLHTINEVQTSSHATNFNLANLIKQGLGFGGSATSQSQQTHTIQTNYGNDNLGEANLFFSSPVIVSAVIQAGNMAQLTGAKITTGDIDLCIIPVKSPN